MLEDVYKHFEEKLKEFIPIEQLRIRSKYCPNCGEKLDSRFS